MLTDMGGFRAPEAWLPNKGTRVASQVLTEARDRDVVPDHRDVPWSPENVLIDTVARLQRDLNDMRAESRFLRTPGVPNVAPTRYLQGFLWCWSRRRSARKLCQEVGLRSC